ncbi:gpmA [Symbiodinium sp. CCMP2592]|nr:gpmA [Symbiodinium sp. CCMP2592]
MTFSRVRADKVLGPGPLPQSPVATSWGWKPATQVEDRDRRYGPVKSEPLVRKAKILLQLSIEGFSLMVTGLVQDNMAFVCREGLPLDYGAVAEDVWKDFDASLSKLANEAAFLRGMLKALGREAKGRGRDMVVEERSKLIEPNAGGLKGRLRENRSPRSVRLGKVVVQTYPANKEIIEDSHGHAPQPPEKEAPTRVRRPFGDVNLNMNSMPFRAEKNFAGWMDVDLTESGKKAAADAGKCLKAFTMFSIARLVAECCLESKWISGIDVEKGLKPGVVFTSKLRRSVCTAWLALMESDNVTLPIINSWRLNERHYGELGRVVSEHASGFLRQWWAWGEPWMFERGSPSVARWLYVLLESLGMAGQGGSLAAALQELQEARQQLRNVLSRATATEDSRPAGSGGGKSGSGGKTRLRFLGHASHRRFGLFLLRVSFRAWAGAQAKAKSGHVGHGPAPVVLAELYFRSRNRAGLLRAFSAWRLSLHRDGRLRRQERLAQDRAAEVARAEAAQHVSEGRLELLCSRLASSTAAVCLLRRSLLVWRYCCHEAQLEAVAEKSQAIQTETLRLSMSGEADKAVALLSAREAALDCELATPLPRCDELIFQLLSARGSSLRYAILRPCWRRWRLRASYGLSWMRQRGVHITLGCQHLPLFEARQLLARVIRTWHYGCGGMHRRLPLWCQERGSAMARGFQMVADMSLKRQRLWLLRCSFGAWVCWGCFLPKRGLFGAPHTERPAADLHFLRHLRWAASQRPPRRRADRGLRTDGWSKLENLQVLRHLQSLDALTARAVLRAWRLQVAKEMAFNAMLMLPDDQEDLQALEFLGSVSAFSAASPSQRWDRQHIEGVDQPRLELPALSGPLAQPLPPVPRAQRAQQPGDSQNERPAWPESRLWSPVSEDVDDME